VGPLGDEARTISLRVRVTEGERDQLADVARDLGLSLSSYVRRAVLRRPMPPRRRSIVIPAINRETYAALGRVSGNLNQLARWANERTGDEAGWRQVLAAHEVLAEVIDALRTELVGARFATEDEVDGRSA